MGGYLFINGFHVQIESVSDIKRVNPWCPLVSFELWFQGTIDGTVASSKVMHLFVTIKQLVKSSFNYLLFTDQFNNFLKNFLLMGFAKEVGYIHSHSIYRPNIY